MAIFKKILVSSSLILNSWPRSKIIPKLLEWGYRKESGSHGAIVVHYSFNFVARRTGQTKFTLDCLVWHYELMPSFPFLLFVGKINWMLLNVRRVLNLFFTFLCLGFNFLVPWNTKYEIILGEFICLFCHVETSPYPPSHG